MLRPKISATIKNTQQLVKNSKMPESRRQGNRQISASIPHAASSYCGVTKSFEEVADNRYQISRRRSSASSNHPRHDIKRPRGEIIDITAL